MIYVITDEKETSSHIGEKFPNHSWDVVSEIQADGQELLRLYEIFPSLPKCNKRVVTFIGHDAQFIVANLAGQNW